ncbi:hypothetical protein DFJ77DRAFT_181853 [Powellomyces hirtus]|nr:hypothetical protein DFJ77DRAFT_181853 [Powellomyces hirtus]
MRLTVQTAKYILVPIILAIFIMYTGLIVYQYIVQTPAISMSLANNPIPFPLFQFSFPYGEEVRMAQNLQQLSAPGVPGSIWTGGPVYMPDSSTNQVAPVSAYFTTTNRSFASVGPARPPRFNATTTYIFDPKGRRWPPSVHLSLGISPSQLIGSDSIPVLRPFIKFQVRGSRFTHDRDFGALMNLDLGQFPPDHNPFADPVRVSVTRDVNSDIQDGLWGQSSTYAVKAYQYKYLNGSNEYFYEVSSVGRIMLPPPSNYITIDIRLATQYLTIYEETQLITKAQSIGAIASAFQILLLTGLIFLFGNGKYSPYGT